MENMKIWRSSRGSKLVLDEAERVFDEQIIEGHRVLKKQIREAKIAFRNKWLTDEDYCKYEDTINEYYCKYHDTIDEATRVYGEAKRVYEEEAKQRKIDDEKRLKFIGGQFDYWRQVGESDGFDLDNVSVPQGTIGLNPFDLERYGARCPDAVLTTRYARFGLHSYNMSHGTKLEFHHIRKFNKTMTLQSTYYFTVAASDPAAPSSLLTLQFGVAQGNLSGCSLNVQCFNARLKDAPREAPSAGGLYLEGMYDFKFPFWPSDFSDSQRFSEVNESEFHGNDNWIRLYLELVLCTNDRGVEEADLSKLQILKVATETVVETNDAPNEVIASNFYITFKGLALARVGDDGEHVERKVIVRRNFNERTRCTSLLGEYGFYVGEVAERRFISRPDKYWHGCSLEKRKIFK